MSRHRQHGRWLICALSVSLATITGCDLAIAGVKDTAAEEATCKDIGFRPKTASFADCVLELLSRKETGGQTVASSPSSPSRISGRASGPRNAPSRSVPVEEVALTPNERTCAGYGFKKGTTQFGQCLMQLDDAQRQAELQQQQYNLQLAQYQQQVAAYNAQQEEIRREKNRRQAEMLMRMSQGMLNSRSPTFLGGLADGFAAVTGNPIPQPVPPMPPSSQNYTIRAPNGDQVYCNYNVAASYMSCR
jgi:hypothetical protein